MEKMKFEVASVLHAELAADLFLDGKQVDRQEAIEMFKSEFQKCEARPSERIYLLASTSISLVAYAGARFYSQEQHENMYQTCERLPLDLETN